MKAFSSLAAVMVLWLAVSFGLWLVYRLLRRRDGSRQERLLSDALALIGEGAAVFAALRTRASKRAAGAGGYGAGPKQSGEALRGDVRGLLNAIEAQSAYFERVNTVRRKIQRTFGLPGFPPLSEILQIRRDLWAASEIFLMEGIRELGPELADAQAYETFEAEARALLFKDGAGSSSDPIELRLAIASEAALAFQAESIRLLQAELDKSRFPSPAELIAVPWSAVKGLAKGLRQARHLLADAATAAQALARTMTSKGLKGAAEELRRARAGMPGKFAAAFEQAGGLARQGGQVLKRHYEFVLEAQELRARYAELLARAPILTEKGKQFLARLELERRAEQFRESSGDFSDWARRRLVAGIAYLIAGLQYLQAKITPAEHKQLAPLAAATGLGSAPPPPGEEVRPLRVLLLPASAYPGGNYRETSGPGRPRRRGTSAAAISGGTMSGGAAPARGGEGRFGDPPANGSEADAADSAYAAEAEGGRGREGRERERPRRGRGSLLDRLSGLEPEADAERLDAAGPKPDGKDKGVPEGKAPPKAKGRRFFRSK